MKIFILYLAWFHYFMGAVHSLPEGSNNVGTFELKQSSSDSNIALKHASPYQVSLQLRLRDNSWKHICGGSLIGMDKIVTAGQCLHGMTEDSQDFRVVAGAHNISGSESSQQVRSIKKAVVHPEFPTKFPMDYDYGVILVETPFILNDAVKFVKMSSIAPSAGIKQCFTSGWGYVNYELQDELHRVELELLGPEVCQNKYPEFVFTGRMLCAGGLNAKYIGVGFNGGPLVCQGNLVGSLSWGDPYNGKEVLPMVYSSVASEINWINSV